MGFQLGLVSPPFGALPHWIPASEAVPVTNQWEHFPNYPPLSSSRPTRGLAGRQCNQAQTLGMVESSDNAPLGPDFV